MRLLTPHLSMAMVRDGFASIDQRCSPSIIQPPFSHNNDMAPARQVIGDSDDDEDYESPIDPLPDQACDAPNERPIESGSTDPSFFRSVYEEQHRDDVRRPTADGQAAPDMWEVPSSPQRPPSRPSTKRKRVDDSAPDASNEATAHATEQRFQIVIDLGGREQDGAETGAEPAGTYPPSTALTESTIAYRHPAGMQTKCPTKASTVSPTGKRHRQDRGEKLW